MPPAIRAENLRKSYGDVQALDGLEIDIPFTADGASDTATP
jgi:ABC-type sugar transport system ATPase subunit